MNIIKNMRTYLLEDELQINVYKNRVNIVNYDSVGQIESNKIIVRYDQGMIVVNGKNLTINKLLHNEILIMGIILNIELR